MRLARMSFMAVLVLGAALPLQGYIGMILGTPDANEFGDCVAGELLEPTVGNLYMGREGGVAGNDILAILNDGATRLGCNSWGGGFYDCPGANFAQEPTTADEAVWTVVPMYPAGATAGDHTGWLFVDVTQGTTADFGANVSQALWPLTAVPGAHQTASFTDSNGNTVWDPGEPIDPAETTMGFDYRLRAVVEFGRTLGAGPTCRVGGDAMGTDYDDRPLMGYNVFRLAGIAAGTSTPADYLDNMVGFIPSGTGSGGGGLNLSNAQADPTANDNDIADAYGIQGTGPTVEDDVVLIYSDNPTAYGNIDPADLTAGVTYAFQPVLKGTAPTGDVDGDGHVDLDLDGDTTPEFISPCADFDGDTTCEVGPFGLGLTADLGGTRHILISGDVTADGSNPTPAGDAVQFEGSYNPRTRAFDLHFISSLEANLAGFNLYRSADQQSYTQVNGSLIPAKGTALAKYVYSDPMRIRARSGDVTVYYKVEAVNMDGSTDLYGPYSVTYSSASELHRSRSIR